MMDMPSLVRRMLIDPQLGTFLEFPTKEDISSQYVHGRVMRESPLFNPLDPQTLNGVDFHLGDHVVYRLRAEEFRGRIVSFYRNAAQDGPLFAEVRPLKMVRGSLIASSNLIDLPVDSLVRKADIVVHR